jgi:hypothetical protein
MSEERTTRSRVSIPRALGITLIAISVSLNALLFLAFDPAIRKVAFTDVFFSPCPYIGLVFIVLGVLLIRSDSGPTIRRAEVRR